MSFRPGWLIVVFQVIYIFIDFLSYESLKEECWNLQLYVWISPLISVSFCFTYFKVGLLCVLLFEIVVSFLVNLSLYHYKMTFLSSLFSEIYFVWYWSAPPAFFFFFFWLVLARHHLFHPFTFKPICVFIFQLCFL